MTPVQNAASTVTQAATRSYPTRASQQPLNVSRSFAQQLGQTKGAAKAAPAQPVTTAAPQARQAAFGGLRANVQPLATAAPAASSTRASTTAGLTNATATPTTPPTLHGDVDGNGTVDAADATALLQYLFQGGSAPSSMAGADANGDGSVNISDVVRILQMTMPPQGGASALTTNK
ncbi:MAG: dockerin type I repeat-containing protein [Planctomycetota bacterium]